MLPDSLTTQLLLRGYAAGFFPMAHPEEGNAIGWYAPDPRAILPLDGLRVPRSLARIVRSNRFTLRSDTAFAEVIDACAEETPDRPSTWISREIREAYIKLNESGFAHSVECWADDMLVGGLYGVALGGAFFGESMFYRDRDASKVALVELVRRLNAGGFTLLDTQFITPHLESLGAKEISRDEYEKRLGEALQQDAAWIP